MNSFFEQTLSRNSLGTFRQYAILWSWVCHRPRTWISISILFLAAMSVAQEREPFIDSIARSEEGVIPVACATWPDSESHVQIKEIKGTGLFVSFEGHFITAAHVIEGNFTWEKNVQPSGKCFPVIYLPAPTWDKLRWLKFKDCVIDSSIDIAVCKTEDNPLYYPDVHPTRLRLRSVEPPHGTAVAFTGFPQSFAVPITSQGHIAGIGEFAKPYHDNRRYILVDKNNWHGVSGGPLYLANGDVIGVMTKMGEGLWDGLGFAILSGPILNFLSEHHIPVWTEQTEQSPNNKPKQ